MIYQVHFATDEFWIHDNISSLFALHRCLLGNRSVLNPHGHGLNILLDFPGNVCRNCTKFGEDSGDLDLVIGSISSGRITVTVRILASFAQKQLGSLRSDFVQVIAKLKERSLLIVEMSLTV